MKNIRKVVSLLLTVIMILSLSLTAFAAEYPSSDERNSFSITVTNENTNISISGKTYYAYKIFDVTYDTNEHYSYTIADEFTGFTYTVGETTYSGSSLVTYLETIDSDTVALNQFAEAALTYVTDNLVAASGTVTIGDNAETGVIELTEPGYYLVAGSATATSDDETEVVAACSLTTTDPQVEVKVKADAPSIEKKITDEEAADETGKYSTASVGDTIPYELTSTVPDMTGYEKYYYVVTDTFSEGLTYNEDLAIIVGTTTLSVTNDLTDSGAVYDVNVEIDQSSGETTLTIVFHNFIQYTTGDSIVITYSATINEDAVVGTDGNPNSVTLEYSSNPNKMENGDPNTPYEPQPGEATGTTPDSITTTYVTGIQINKVDEDGNTLTGAEFAISGLSSNVIIINGRVFQEDNDNGTYYKLKDGSYTTDVPVTDTTADGYNANLYDSTSTKYSLIDTVDKDTAALENISTSGYVNASGVVKFTSLGEGTYNISEVIVPDGYNKVDDLKVTITCTYPDADNADQSCTWSATLTDVEGNEISDSSGSTVSATYNDETGCITFNVENHAGALLPSTGGMGTTIFYIVGGILVVAAAVLLITKGRMSRSE